ncbi:MAG: DUF523 domain-containing protein [Desulfuromonadaceae bacterium]|nr:DUF523 domain-containing protein [Desulfuromonadaceae bacterium]
MTQPIIIGVSACLLGEHVRYDAGHKHDRHITDILGAYFTFVPVCPEVGCGLPIPREAMRLEGNPAAPRLMTIQSRVDRTERMLVYCAAKVGGLMSEDICGFIFKERSPSCGLTKIPLSGNGVSELFAIGLFAHEVVRCFPLMPMEEAERLHNPRIRNDFIERVLLYYRKKDVKKESCMDHTPLKANNLLKYP